MVVDKALPPVKLKLPIFAVVNAPTLVIPTADDPVIISTPLNLSELAPVKFRLTLDVHQYKGQGAGLYRHIKAGSCCLLW